MISNSWVVHGSRTDSGSVSLTLETLANIGEESIFQMTNLQFGGQELTGSTFLGVPGILSGRSKTAAWSQTSSMSQNTANLYLEYLSDDKTQYLIDGEWADLMIEKDYIKVAGRDDIELVKRFTHRGPLFEYDDLWLSLQWTGEQYPDENSYFDM